MSDELDLLDLRAALEARNRQIAAVHGISRLLSSSLDLDDRLRDVLTVSMRAVDAVAGTIFLHRPEDDALVFRYVAGEKAVELTGHAMDAAKGLAGAVFRSGTSQITNSPQTAAEHDTEVETRTGFATTNIVTVPLKYQDGRPVGVMQLLNKVGGAFDENDLAVLEIVACVAAASIETAQLARAAQAAAIANAVGDLSHDIKNKVAPIVIAVYTLRSDMAAMFDALDRIPDSVPADVTTRVRDASEAVRQAYDDTFDVIMGQVDAVQEYTRLIADALKGTVSQPQLEPIDIASVIEAQLVELDPIAQSHGVACIRRFADVPVCRLDRFQIERAVYNLVNNAIPETPAGGSVTVAIIAETTGRFPDGRFVEIEVTDTGRGMAPNVLEHILRGDPKTTKPGGTGLGTRIVHNAVAAHHGVFTGRSEVGVGTTFCLRLPLVTD